MQTKTRLARIEDAIEAIRVGKIVIVVDDADRETRGSADRRRESPPEAIQIHGALWPRVDCLAMTPERLDALEIPLMVSQNSSRFDTGFCVTSEAKHRTSTGISAADRAATVLTAIDPDTVPGDLARPGHMFPLRSRTGGVLARTGQTEAAVDLARIAGLYPAGVICEVMNEDGTMARVPQLTRFAKRHGLLVITVADLIKYRMHNESLVKRVATAKMPTDPALHLLRRITRPPCAPRTCRELGDGNACSCRALVRAYRRRAATRFAATARPARPRSPDAEEGRGVLLSTRRARGSQQIRAYELQMKLDTVEANERPRVKAATRYVWASRSCAS